MSYVCTTIFTKFLSDTQVFFMLGISEDGIHKLAASRDAVYLLVKCGWYRNDVTSLVQTSVEVHNVKNITFLIDYRRILSVYLINYLQSWHFERKWEERSSPSVGIKSGLCVLESEFLQLLLISICLLHRIKIAAFARDEIGNFSLLTSVNWEKQHQREP